MFYIFLQRGDEIYDLISLHWKIMTNIFYYRIASVCGLVLPTIVI